MDMPIIAVSEIPAGVPSNAPAAATVAAGSTNTAAPNGDNSMFGKLFTGMTVQAGQNAAVENMASQAKSLQELIQQPVVLKTPDPADMTSGQNGQTAAAKTEGLLKGTGSAVINGLAASLNDQMLTTQELPMLSLVTLSSNKPAAGDAAAKTGSKEKESSKSDNSAQSESQVLGMINSDISAMLMMLQQPKQPVSPANQTSTAKVTAAADAVQPASTVNTASSAKASGSDWMALQTETAKKGLTGDLPQDAAPAGNSLLSAAADQPLTEAHENSKGETRISEGKTANLAQIRQKLAGQVTGAESAGKEMSAEKPARIDLELVDVVIRESAVKIQSPEPEKAAGQSSAEATDSLSMPLMAHSSEKPEAAKQAQVTASEPAKPVTHEQIMSQVKEKLSDVEIRHDGNQVVLRLHPEELGELKIDLRMDNQRLRVEIVTENSNVKEALMSNMGSLKEVLAKQNISMDRFDVSMGGSGFNQAFRDGKAWEQQQPAASNRPVMKWIDERQADGTVLAAADQYNRNNDYSMVDVRF